MLTSRDDGSKSRGAASRRVARSRLQLALVPILAASIGLAAAPASAACNAPRCIEVTVPVPKTLSVPDSRVRILLPEDYDTSHQRYPVLYLLHGAGDTYTAWTDLTDVQEFSGRFPLIIVMPDGGHDANAGWYSDWLDGSRQWETFHTRILRSYIDRSFRTLATRDHRAIAGLSMGGFGTMSYAARHRDLYRAAASFSGAVDTLYQNPETNVLFVTGLTAPGVWGDPKTHLALWRAHNPTDLAGSLRDTALFLATGDGTTGGPAGDVDDPGAYGVEAVVHDMTLDLAHALDAARVSYQTDFYQGGYHGWPYWERELHWALPQIVSIISKQDGTTCPGSGSGSCRLPLFSHR